MTPALLAKKTQEIFKGTRAKVTVLDEKQIAKLSMGGLLGVGQGAVDKPRFIIIEYKNTAENKKKTKTEEGPIVFVGKGVTFDTGGLQVKPGMSMYEMHMDMSGGASVIAAIGAIAKLGLKTHVVGLIPAAENAIGEKAIRPGDVLKMMSGTTVEVLHTDAEGRIILADALHYAKRYNPRLVVDIATLTGAALVAVGVHAHVIMTKDRALEDTFRELGEESGDLTFPLPLWDEYMQYTKGTNGDISNIASGDSRNGGSINGGMFLAHFTKKMKWVHIDMAPRMTSTGSDKLAKGATGEPTRLLVKIAEKF
jgi:leucyl aminopeptidase